MTEKFNSIKDIIEDIRNGKMVVMVDDESRENEGDLIFAASKVTADKVNFMATHGRGLICVPLLEERIESLGLKQMTTRSKDLMATAFTISVDAQLGITTGISAQDRSRTIEILADPKRGPGDLVSPGHIFPLKAKKGGVLTRAGHTEAACDLSRLAGLDPSGVICEIMNEDGTMSRLPELMKFAKKHDLKIGTIQDLIEYRRQSDKLVEKISEATIPTVFGKWAVKVYKSYADGREHIILQQGKITDEPVLVRVHSECFTGDVFGSMRCDCQDQLIAAMEKVHEQKAGVILYMRQEGRGIGLANKLKAYSLQDEGLDTVEANEKLGFKPDLREYGIGAQILKDLGLFKLKLMTNNPRKIVGLEGHGLQVVERITLSTPSQPHNAKYLKAKKEKLGHILDL